MSVRNGGRSIADTMRGLVGEGAGKLFMLFVILALVYVIIVFLDLTANTFAKQPAVATASGWFIVVAIVLWLPYCLLDYFFNHVIFLARVFYTRSLAWAWSVC